MTQDELSKDAQIIEMEIKEYADELGRLAWKIGKSLLGEKATAVQIANHIAKDFGYPFEFTPKMILNFMARVKHNELP